MKNETVIIETHQGGAVEWGVSFTDSNPEAADYVACASYEDAEKLKEKVDAERKKIAVVEAWIEKWKGEKGEVAGYDPWHYAAKEIEESMQRC